MVEQADEIIDCEGMDGFEIFTVSGGKLKTSLDEDRILVEIFSQTNAHMLFSREELEMLIELFQEILTCQPPLRC